MTDGILNNKLSKGISVTFKILLLLGGAWLIFSAISDVALSVLQYTENMPKFTVDYVLRISVGFFAELLLGVLFVFLSLFEKGKGIRILWFVTALAQSLFVIYSTYDYFGSNLLFFKDFSFSREIVLNIFEFILYIAYLISLAFICFYGGKFLSVKFRTVTRMLSILGVFYLISMVIISFVNNGQITIYPIIEKFADLFTIMVIYAYGLRINDMILSFENVDNDYISEEIELNTESVSSANLDNQSSASNDYDFEIEDIFIETIEDSAEVSIDEILNQILEDDSVTKNDAILEKSVDSETKYTDAFNDIDEALKRIQESVDGFDHK